MFESPFLMSDSDQNAHEPGSRAGFPDERRPIAVIGAGFSGTIAALQLLRHLPPEQPVLLCERAPDFARGIAYATGDSAHLLNVRASNMSAFAGEPLHFVDWLERNLGQSGLGPDMLQETSAGLFVSRGLYGAYLRALLNEALRPTPGRAPLRLFAGDIRAITPLHGQGYLLRAASGATIPVAGVVLAIGNLPPADAGDPRICETPWAEKAWRPLEPDRPVLIMGTALSMVDVALSLRRRGFAGGIVALSRAGLLPHKHAPGQPWLTPQLTLSEEMSLPLLMRRVRREVARAAEEGIGWRPVIDSLRPVTARIWARLPGAERRRFLRHVRRNWDIHRHRMAPPHAALIADMIAAGDLRIAAGRIRGMQSGPDGVTVRYSPRGGRAPDEVLHVQRVIIASALEGVTRAGDPLVRDLLSQKLARVDRQGLGLDVTDSLELLQADGTRGERIWALGPVVRGVFWECVAVPDIRVQAAQLAVGIVARLRADAQM